MPIFLNTAASLPFFKLSIYSLVAEIPVKQATLYTFVGGVERGIERGRRGDRGMGRQGDNDNFNL